MAENVDENETFEVELFVDGKKVAMNSYVRKVFFRVMSALISTLKGVEGWKEAEVRIRK